MLLAGATVIMVDSLAAGLSLLHQKKRLLVCLAFKCVQQYHVVQCLSSLTPGLLLAPQCY